MHLVVYYVAGLPKVDWVDDFVVTILFVTVQIFRLTAMPRVMKEERVVGSRILHQPMHGSQDVLLRRLTHGILLIIGQEHHVLSLVAKMSV